MLELLQKLLIGHIHKYTIVDKYNANVYSEESSTMPFCQKETLTLQCQVCGKIKYKKVKK